MSKKSQVLQRDVSFEYLLVLKWVWLNWGKINPEKTTLLFTTTLETIKFVWTGKHKINLNVSMSESKKLGGNWVDF